MHLPARVPVRAAVTLAAAGAAVLAPLPIPALAGPQPRLIIIDGPTNVHDAAYSGVRTRVIVREGRRTDVRLTATGFPAAAAGKTFGAHVHRDRCGAEPAASGPHYRNPHARRHAPVREKEIWLDLKVKPDGTAESRTLARWRIARGAAHSVVIHAHPTDPKTGDAGPRLLCTTVPF
ncbi:superoxide dismutase family protein [Actinomadura graeca]|uniref:Superoxide dismutase family protein n=1 Tax=Actinomadura graeca TaxID=2750812 RepID=A0ABX8R202_9ACTN|nr:superoxide dismutase family protein [Actinomadura graeca]QXJ24581.1 superoxide dismutase family protein [Actinomadura graeca]